VPYRSLVSLYRQPNYDGRSFETSCWYISFGHYYKRSRLYTGKSEKAEITEEQLYELLKPVLKTTRRSPLLKKGVP